MHFRDPLVQQGLDRAHASVGVEATLHRGGVQIVVQRQKTHALMMTHVGAHQNTSLALAGWLPTKVNCLIEAIVVQQPFIAQTTQVLHCLSWHDVDGQQGCIGRYDQLSFFSAALEAQVRHAKGLVLIGSVDVQVTKGRFRDAPGHTMLVSIGDLDLDRLAGGLIQQRIAHRALEQQRHQVLEHGTGPAHQHRLPADLAIWPAHREPVLGRYIPTCDGDKAPQSSFARQQVIIRVIKAIFGQTVANGKELASGIIEKTHINRFGKRTQVAHQVLAHAEHLAREPLSLGEGRVETGEPFASSCVSIGAQVRQTLEQRYRVHLALSQVEQSRNLGKVVLDGR